MSRGRLLTQGPVASLASLAARARLAVTTPDVADAVRVLKEHGITDLTTTADDRITGELPADPAPCPPLEDLNAALVTAGVRVRAFGLERASLEDAFLALTGEGFDVAG
jgi:ABC-2 type transport system ATP-binding protein